MRLNRCVDVINDIREVPVSFEPPGEDPNNLSIKEQRFIKEMAMVREEINDPENYLIQGNIVNFIANLLYNGQYRKYVKPIKLK